MGVQYTLRLPELESVLQADLDDYSHFEGEEVLVADTGEIITPA